MNDLEFMVVAFNAAAKVNPHKTKSNPRVGCTVVLEGEIISTGAHEVFGEAHAEVNALKNLIPGCNLESINNDDFHPGMEVSKATIYITLEPCVKTSLKKTPACTDLLLKFKPARVVIGLLDPHFPGQGVAQLKAAGIKVEVLNTKHHQILNPWFETWITTQKPFMTLKVAQSLDGKITPASKDYLQGVRGLTNALTQQEVHSLRALNQALLSSTETVLEDDPQLDVRHAKNLDFLPSAPDLIVVGKREIPKTAKIFKAKNRSVHFVKDLKDLVPFCRENQIASVMTECGGSLNTQLIEQRLIDQIELFTAPIICGDTAKPGFTKELDLSLFHLKNVCHLENDLWQTSCK